MSDKRAPRRSLNDWMELVTECRQSGLTDAAWCEAQDLDIIGFAIALNDQLLTTATDIDDVLQIEKKGNFELYLLTYKKSINVDEVLSAIKNEKEDTEAAEIIQYMNSQKIVAKWEELPTVNLIIITDEVKDALIQKKEAFVQKTYQINEEKLFRIAKANANEYKTILNFEEEFVLPNKGGEATVVLCKAKQLIDILKNEDDMIRLNLFDENVRAYQGNTDVNQPLVVDGTGTLLDIYVYQSYQLENIEIKEFRDGLTLMEHMVLKYLLQERDIENSIGYGYRMRKIIEHAKISLRQKAVEYYGWSYIRSMFA